MDSELWENELYFTYIFVSAWLLSRSKRDVDNKNREDMSLVPIILKR
jgi:hypothetical protein